MATFLLLSTVGPDGAATLTENPDRLKAVNVYVIVEDDGITLIDSGWALDAAKDALTSALATLGAGLALAALCIWAVAALRRPRAVSARAAQLAAE